MRECPACHHENLPGSDYCETCHISLTLEDTNPHYRTSRVSEILADPISNAGLPNALTVAPHTPVAEVIQHMQQDNVGCAMIVRNNEVLGIFTKRDVVKHITSKKMDLTKIQVHTMMSPSPEVLDETDSIAYVINKMAMRNRRHVPIRRKDGSLAFFSTREMIQYLF